MARELTQIQEIYCSITERRVYKALLTLNSLVKQQWARFKIPPVLCQIISMKIIIDPVSKIMSRYLRIGIMTSWFLNSIKVLDQLLFWKNTLAPLNVKATACSACLEVIYSDTSLSGFACCETGTVS